MEESSNEDIWIPCDICDDIVRFSEYESHINYHIHPPPLEQPIIHEMNLPNLGMRLMFNTLRNPMREYWDGENGPEDDPPDELENHREDEEDIVRDDTGMLPAANILPLLFGVNSNNLPIPMNIESNVLRQILDIFRPPQAENELHPEQSNLPNQNQLITIPIRIFNNNISEYEMNQLIQEMMGGNVEIGIRKVDKVLVEYKTIENEEDICIVCQEKLEKKLKEEELVQTIKCKHAFCKNCILPWFQKSRKCPTCMQELEELQL